MKAFVVLCVLIGIGLTQGQTQFCTSGTCGCCLIEKQLRRIEERFNSMYGNMSKSLSDTKQALYNIKATRSIFSATLSSKKSCNPLNPPAHNAAIIYDSVHINLGNNYSPTSGVFTAPLKGVYSFALTLCNNSTNTSCAAIAIEGATSYRLMESDSTDTQDCSSAFITQALEAGDKVKVIQPDGCYICGPDKNFNTFTGFLLYATA